MDDPIESSGSSGAEPCSCCHRRNFITARASSRRLKAGFDLPIGRSLLSLSDLYAPSMVSPQDVTKVGLLGLPTPLRLDIAETPKRPFLGSKIRDHYFPNIFPFWPYGVKNKAVCVGWHSTTELRPQAAKSPISRHYPGLRLPVKPRSTPLSRPQGIASYPGGEGGGGIDRRFARRDVRWMFGCAMSACG